MYQLTLDKFTGPLDLLLNLVEDEKLSINEISLAQVADQYIAYLKSLEELSKEELAAFLVIAATLILIKSRSLLPNLSLTEEEELDIRDLERRIATFKFFRIIAKNIDPILKRNNHLFGREPYAGLTSVFLPPERMSKEVLHHAIASIISSFPQEESLPEDEVKRIISLEEKIRELRDRFEIKASLTFEEMKRGAKEKVEVIVSFLAMLELIKQGFLMFEQRGIFGTIELTQDNKTQK